MVSQRLHREFGRSRRNSLHREFGEVRELNF
jgi:hypothetical protein